MIDHVLQLLMLATGAAAVLLASKTDRRAKWGWLIGLVAQPLWLYSTWNAGQWGMFLLSCVYTWGWGEGAWNHWRANARGTAAP